MGYDGRAGMSGAMSGAATGAAVGSVVPGIGTAIGALGGAALGAGMGFMGGDSPDYSKITELYRERANQIGAFASNLAAARARYLTSLNNMYNNAYARFTNNVEPGFAARGMQINGGAFASALARKTAEYQDAGDVAAVGMEREDLSRVDQLYGQNTAGYMSAISGGPMASFSADREDMRSIGSFAGKLAMMKFGKGMVDDGYNAYYNRYGMSTPNTNSYPVDNGLGITDYRERVS